MRTVTLKLPEDLDRALTDLAERLQLTRSAVIREAIAAYARGRGETVGSRAADLAGTLEGPPDLSTADEHMDGYGK